MKNNFKLTLLGLIFFTTSIYGCDQKEVGNISVIMPQTPITTVLCKSFYVSENTGSDANTGLSIAFPLKTITAGQSLASAGDTVFLMNGNYSPATTIQLLKSGTANKYITYKAYKGHSPKFSFLGAIWNAVSINRSYIVVDGIEFQGNNQNLTYEGAFAYYNDKIAGGNNNNLYATYNMNGVSIGGPSAESKFSHHIIIRNCKIHDFPGGGLGAIQADYLTFEGNTVYNNAWYMMYGGSGISILTPFAMDETLVTNAQFLNFSKSVTINQKTTKIF